MPGEKMDHVILTPAQVEEYFNEHIPYRLNQLLGFRLYKAHLGPGMSRAMQRRIGPSMVEAAAISGRLFLDVLGVTETREGLAPKTKWRRNDVSLLSFGLPLIHVNSIPVEDRSVLKTFLFQASKSTAHLTHNEEPMDGWKCLPAAVDIVETLLKRHLYQPLGRTMLPW